MKIQGWKMCGVKSGVTSLRAGMNLVLLTTVFLASRAIPVTLLLFSC